MKNGFDPSFRTSLKTFKPGKIISGGQSGADLGALVAARRLGIPTGGVAPRGYRTEKGPQASVLKAFGLVESESGDYADRTRANILAAQSVLVFAEKPNSAGTRLTLTLCRDLGRSVCLVPKVVPSMVPFVRFFLSLERPEVLNVAGNRESVAPGIARAVADFLMEVFEG